MLVILIILFYLLHQLIHAFRRGWRPRRPGAASGNSPR